MYYAIAILLRFCVVVILTLAILYALGDIWTL
jgi:hypothetical protein